MKVSNFIKLASAAALILILASTTFAQAPGTWNRTGSLSAARFGITAVLLNDGRVLVAGGLSNRLTKVHNSAELYDPLSGKWTATGSMSTARAYYVATLLQDGRVLIAGGCTNVTCYAATATAEVFDPASGVWQPTGNMSTIRYHFTGTLLQNGNVLAVGGCNQAGPCTSPARTTEVYSPATGVWSLSGSLSLGRDSHTATLMTDGRVLIAGGFSFVGTEPRAEMYDPATGAISQMANMKIGRANHSATLLTNGKVLIAAGVVGRTDYRTGNTSEVYDPVANKWTLVGNLNNRRGEQPAVVLPNGKVLVAGGVAFAPGRNANVLASAELFDATTSTWSLTGRMTAPRDEHGMVLLSNGTVLAVGGVANGGTILASAELYTP